MRKPFTMTMARARVLNAARWEVGGSSVAEVARECGKAESTVRAQLKDLTEAGLLRCVLVGARRVGHYSITTSGRRELKGWF